MAQYVFGQIIMKSLKTGPAHREGCDLYYIIDTLISIIILKQTGRGFATDQKGP